MRISQKASIFLVLILMVTLVFGCSTDKEILGPEPGAAGFSGSPDILMDNFQKAYTAMDLREYEKLLHQDFIFSFQACDVEKLGLSKDHYTREDELATTAHMFSKTPHVKDNGEVVAPILTIDDVFLGQDVKDFPIQRDGHRLGRVDDPKHILLPHYPWCEYETNFVNRGEHLGLDMRSTNTFVVGAPSVSPISNRNRMGAMGARITIGFVLRLG